MSRRSVLSVNRWADGTYAVILTFSAFSGHRVIKCGFVDSPPGSCESVLQGKSLDAAERKAR
jgi:hypothetical protein